MVSQFNIYIVHLKCFGSIRYHSNEYTTSIQLNQKLNTDIVQAICAYGDYRPPVHNDITMQQGHIGSKKNQP